jgi:hypothetical protein
MSLERALDAIQLIHQAFNQGYDGALRKKKQDQDLKLDLEANDRANKQLDLHKEEAERALAMQKATLDQMHFQNKAKISEMVRSGALPANLVPGADSNIGSDAMGNNIPGILPQTKGPVSFGGETLNDYVLPSEVIQQQIDAQKAFLPSKIAEITATKTAENQAEEPFKVADEERKKNSAIAVNAPQIASHEEIARLAQEGENKRAQLAASTSLAGHRIAANSSRFSAMAGAGLLPVQVEGLQNVASQVATGIRTLQSTGKDSGIIGKMLANSKLAPANEKDIDKLKTVPLAIDTMGMIKQFTQDYGTDSKLKAYLNGKLAESDLPTEMKASLDAINTRAIGFSKGFEGTTGIRFTNQDLKLVLGGMVKAGSTEKANEILQGNLEKLIKNGTNMALIRYSPEQKASILSANGFFDSFAPESKSGKKLDHLATSEQFLKTGKLAPVYR